MRNLAMVMMACLIVPILASCAGSNNPYSEVNALAGLQVDGVQDGLRRHPRSWTGPNLYVLNATWKNL
jgi:hypothetical protein